MPRRRRLPLGGGWSGSIGVVSVWLARSIAPRSYSDVGEPSRCRLLALEALDLVDVLERERDLVQALQQPLADLGVDLERDLAAVEGDDLALEVDRGLARPRISARTSSSGRVTGSKPILVQLA